jgi:hypothetical protein
MPSLEEVGLHGFDITPADCRERITAAQQEGALLNVKVRNAL